ncbi:hypothetical protein Hanom_Chr04g00298531 [Helianthus anomalus]
MNRTQIRILKQPNKISLRSLLKSSNSRALKPQISFKILSNLSHKPLKWELPDQQFSALLVKCFGVEEVRRWIEFDRTVGKDGEVMDRDPLCVILTNEIEEFKEGCLYNCISIPPLIYFIFIFSL